MLKWFLGNIYKYSHFQQFLHIEMAQKVDILIHKDKDLFIVHSPYHGCWWPGFLQCQAFNNHDIILGIIWSQYDLTYHSWAVIWLRLIISSKISARPFSKSSSYGKKKEKKLTHNSKCFTYWRNSTTKFESDMASLMSNLICEAAVLSWLEQNFEVIS